MNPTTERPKNKPFTIPEFSTVTGISTRTAWRLLDNGKVRSIRIGGRVFVPAAEVERVQREGCE